MTRGYGRLKRWLRVRWGWLMNVVGKVDGGEGGDRLVRRRSLKSSDEGEMYQALAQSGTLVPGVAFCPFVEVREVDYKLQCGPVRVT